MHLEVIVIISAIVLFVTLGLIVLYRKSSQGEGYRYEKVRNYETDSVKNLMKLPPLLNIHQNPPPSQPFIPSPQQKYPIPYEAYSNLDSNYDLENNVNAKFYKMDTAYPPEGRMMDLPPVVKRARMLPPGQQPLNPYSGYPSSTYLSDQDINKFYAKFVPDYLWCKDGVCE